MTDHQAASLSIAEIEDADVASVIALWQRCDLTRPWNDPAADIALARKGPNATLLIGRNSHEIVASVLVGHDGHRGWVYYVSVDPGQQGNGHGRVIMDAAEQWLRERGIEKMQLMVRGDNIKVHEFYKALGYGEQQRVVFAKWLDGRELTP